MATVVTVGDESMRVTLATALVMQAIANGHRYGFEIVDVTDYPTGTVYPALRRLERAGFVRSQWEPERQAAEEGRPARRNYELTAAGLRALDSTLDTMRRLSTERDLRRAQAAPSRPSGDRFRQAARSRSR